MIKRMMMLMILIMMMMVRAALVEYKCRLTGGSRRRRRVDPEPLTGFNLMNSLRIREIQFSAIGMQLKFREYAMVPLFCVWKIQFKHVFKYPYIAPNPLCFYHHHIKKDKATTFEYFYLKPFWLFDWSKLGSSGAVIRWSWFCLGLACPHLFVQPRFWPFHAQLDTLQPQKCWLHSNQHYHHIWLIRTAWKKSS